MRFNLILVLLTLAVASVNAGAFSEFWDSLFPKPIAVNDVMMSHDSSTGNSATKTKDP
ncbi:hypothetical protein J3Q64DRAFT_1843591 [Phycomyces blakesleeanus]|uniref:Uncharacterized protein n=2 Tax=Phycomyces blakesleeanus TaxID=4837 RepID=A0A162Y1Z7_PHYB8|nr:hypothetical protein PHYBLDRAFT_141805 [Phycomyces blakesleeanus NRRL 1555(-)]OAD77945.1 hypothetical protein PHYBLDRAFT_141805 [Phycomyces blakesleeanus NRRL 1555(-)]|eukprot:XP_018295985.1 hypothetical protein PHYBLDRAFT_141805 [Phycomyces blakesleeanus NRRL 1555(-)]